jgi:polygalacturonase
MLSALISSCTTSNPDSEIARYLKDLPFEIGEISLPLFPDYTVMITDYSAVGDGHTINTDAINKAIQICAEAGGGEVIVPPGIWLTGPVKLANNINLIIQKGAVLLFSGKFEDYPLIETYWNGLEKVRCTSPISGWDLENVAITGDGIIDGNGEAWRPVKRWKMTDLKWDALLKSGGVVRYWKRTDAWFPSEEAFLGEALVDELEKRENVSIDDYKPAREFLRPTLIQLIRCKNVLLDGPTFQNSPNWNTHFLLSENIVVRNSRFLNPWNAQNGDGLDLESCKNALVYNCTFDVGDDAICMKSGRNEYGRKRAVPLENIVIRDCTVLEGHTGFAIGSEMSGGVKNIIIKNCQFLGTITGVRIKSNRERGGIVENIFIDNILMEGTKENAIWLGMFYQKKSWSKYNAVDKEPPPIAPVSDSTPSFRQISFKNIICKGAKRAILIEGLAERAIENIKMDRLLISSIEGIVATDIDGLELTNSRIICTSGPVIYLNNSRNVTFINVEFPGEYETLIKLRGSRTDKVEMRGYDQNALEGLIEIGQEVKMTNELIQK